MSKLDKLLGFLGWLAFWSIYGSIFAVIYVASLLGTVLWPKQRKESSP